MRASVFIATSLDGFIARPDGGLDWLEPLPDQGPIPDHGYDAFMAEIDVLVMGRATFETVLGFGIGWPYQRPVVVLSSAPVSIPADLRAAVEWMTGDPAEIMSQLAERGHSHAYIDGGKTVQRFLEAGLIERMIISRIPVLLGAGIPLFGPLSRDVRWRHVTTRSFEGGLVQSEYHLDR